VPNADHNQTMTSKTDKLRAVFLTALMIGSVFAAGVAFTGSAAAAANDVGAVSASDVTADQTSTTQTASLVVEGNNAASNQTVTINTSAARDAGVTVSSATVTSDNATDATATVNGNGNVDVEVDDGATAAGADYSVTVSITHDTSGVSAASGVTYDFEGNTEASASFDVIEANTMTVDSAAPASVADAQLTDDNYEVTQTQDVTVTVADGADNVVTVDVSEAVDAGLGLTDVANNVSTANTGDVAVDNVELDDTTLTFNVSDDTTGDGIHTETFDLDVTFSTGDLTTDNRIRHMFSDEFGNDVTSTFKTIVPGVTITQTDANTEVFSGETVTFEDATGAVTGVEVWSTDSDGNADSREANLNSSPGSSINYDSGNLEEGDYIVRFDNGTRTNVNLSVSNLSLTAELQSDSITDTESISVDTTSADPLGAYTASVYEAGADIEDDDPVAEKTGESFDGSGESTTSFAVDSQSDIEAGNNYTVVITHDDSGVTAQTDEVEVTDAADASASFENVDGSAIGDIATVNVSLTNTDTATVNFGSNEAGYQANVTVENNDDNDYVELSINTYTMANQTGTDAFVAGNSFYVEGDTDDQVTNVEPRTGSSLSEPLDDGRYRVTVRQGTDASATPNAITRMQLTDAEGVTDQNIWTAPAATELSDFPFAADLSEDDAIAEGDYVVHEFSADGVFGVLQNTSADNDTAALSTALQNDELDLSVLQTDASTQTNRDPKPLNYTATLANGNGTVVSDAQNSTIYVAVDLANTITDAPRDINFGNDVYNATAGLNGTTTDLIGEDAGAASAEFSAAELEEELSQNEFEVTNEVNQTITGSSTAADGTEYNIYVESDETQGDGFIEPENTATVEDGELSAEVDFDEASVNDTFTVLLEGPDGEQVDSSTGVVVASVDDGNETTTEAPDDTTEAPDDTTEAPDDTTEAPDDTTEAPDDTTEAADTTEEDDDGGSGGSIPGFGVGIALVAVLGAALLALRE